MIGEFGTKYKCNIDYIHVQTHKKYMNSRGPRRDDSSSNTIP